MSMRWSEEWARFKLPGRCNPSQTILNDILSELDDGFTGNLLGHHTSIIPLSSFFVCGGEKHGKSHQKASVSKREDVEVTLLGSPSSASFGPRSPGFCVLVSWGFRGFNGRICSTTYWKHREAIKTQYNLVGLYYNRSTKRLISGLNMFKKDKCMATDIRVAWSDEQCSSTGNPSSAAGSDWMLGCNMGCHRDRWWLHCQENGTVL